MIYRWLSLWEGIGAQGNPYLPLADLYTNYSKKGRIYHAWKHIVRCITALNDVPSHYFRELDHVRKNSIPCDYIIEMILWGHDVIYVPGAHDNEEQSVAKMEYILKRAKVTQGFIDETCQGIMATKHLGRPNNPVFWWALDIDLLSFGQSWDIFSSDSKDIREEFRNVVPSDEDFENGRREVLSRFNRDPFYFTEYFESTRGKQARANIEKALGI